jgi:hypothetical protein
MTMLNKMLIAITPKLLEDVYDNVCDMVIGSERDQFLEDEKERIDFYAKYRELFPNENISDEVIEKAFQAWLVAKAP